MTMENLQSKPFLVVLAFFQFLLFEKKKIKKTRYIFQAINFIFRKCPYREPKLYCSVTPGKVSSMSLDGAEKLGVEIANKLIKKNALEIMLEARNEILNSP